eukprot:m.15504 g.15504  ORF g.15504 m.15504 type:complete len:516 (+) comp6640_c0_seq1:474-2021(+)
MPPGMMGTHSDSDSLESGPRARQASLQDLLDVMKAVESTVNQKTQIKRSYDKKSKLPRTPSSAALKAAEKDAKSRRRSTSASAASILSISRSDPSQSFTTLSRESSFLDLSLPPMQTAEQARRGSRGLMPSHDHEPGSRSAATGSSNSLLDTSLAMSEAINDASMIMNGTTDYDNPQEKASYTMLAGSASSNGFTYDPPAHLRHQQEQLAPESRPHLTPPSIPPPSSPPHPRAIVKAKAPLPTPTPASAPLTSSNSVHTSSKDTSIPQYPVEQKQPMKQLIEPTQVQGSRVSEFLQSHSTPQRALQRELSTQPSSFDDFSDGYSSSDFDEEEEDDEEEDAEEEEAGGTEQSPEAQSVSLADDLAAYDLAGGPVSDAEEEKRVQSLRRKHRRLPSDDHAYLIKYSWYAGFLSRMRAQEMLENKPPGTFLVRKTQTQVVLTIRKPTTTSECNHLEIKHSADGFEIAAGESFPRIQNLVEHYIANSADFSSRLWGRSDIVLQGYTLPGANEPPPSPMC